MNRRSFIQQTAGVAAGALTMNHLSGQTGSKKVTNQSVPQATENPYPLAITMWDFSWLERNWPGAGYEDWDQALGELVERGYDAVRIDAYPHLIYDDPEAEYLLLPHWHAQDWGSPEINRVRVQPNLNRFLAKCAEYKIRVGLSSWFRENENDLRMKLDTPEKLGEAWLKTIQSIDRDQLLDTVFYVDFCNEWTGPAWCPFFENDPPEAIWSGWYTDKSRDWMRRAIAVVKAEYPQLPYTFSFTGEMKASVLKQQRYDMLDFLEPHIWMTQAYGSEFYNSIGYKFDRFTFTSYRNLALHGEKTYREKEGHWKQGLTDMIQYAAEWSRTQRLPLVTTECWGVVDYRDWPLLDWGWVKDLCALGTREAAATGRWLAISTSNFCGPQFVGMWRDIDWHRRLTDEIHTSHIEKDVVKNPLSRRMKAIL